MKFHQFVANKPSSGEHISPVRSDFFLYWEVLQSGVGIPYDFPGHLYYPGLAPAYTIGLHSQTVQATVVADMESIWNKYSITGGTGGASSTTVAVTGNGQRIIQDCRITGTGIPADTFVVSYDNPGNASGNMVLSQAATITNGTTLSVWAPGGHWYGPFGGNGGVTSTSLTITSDGDKIRVGAPIYGYGIPPGTRVVSYSGYTSGIPATTGTLVMSQAAAVANGCQLQIGHDFETARMYIADMELGGATPTSMQNCLTWMRGAGGYGVTPYPKGIGSAPMGIYWGRECALGRSVASFEYLTASGLQAVRDDNSSMTAAVTGTGNATCNFVCPENYNNFGPGKIYYDMMWLSKEWQRQSIPGKLVPMVNPKDLRQTTIGKRSWRAMLEQCYHDPNMSGLFIWHADRNSAWDATEGWFQATLEFIAAHNLTTAPLVR